MDGIRGSRSSGSFSLQRNLKVDPRINSFGCCKSWTKKIIRPDKTTDKKFRMRKKHPHVIYNIRTLRYASHTRIISCSNFPSGWVFGTISQNNSSSFLILWSCDGRTNRMIVISMFGNFCPLSNKRISISSASAFVLLSPFSKNGMTCQFLKLRHNFDGIMYRDQTSAELQSVNPGRPENPPACNMALPS